MLHTGSLSKAMSFPSHKICSVGHNKNCVEIYFSEVIKWLPMFRRFYSESWYQPAQIICIFIYVYPVNELSLPSVY